MRDVKPLHAVSTSEGEDWAAEAEYPADEEYWEIVRVSCPECGRPIALLAEDEQLPQHALCATRWNPFGLTVCPGSGRSALDAPPLGGSQPVEEDAAALLTLPEGLDWRMQPFSHARRADPLRIGRAA